MTHCWSGEAPSRDPRIQITRSYSPVLGISRKSFSSRSGYSQKDAHKTRADSSAKSLRPTLPPCALDPRSGLEQWMSIGRLNSAAAERINCPATTCSFCTSGNEETNMSIVLMSNGAPRFASARIKPRSFRICILLVLLGPARKPGASRMRPSDKSDSPI